MGSLQDTIAKGQAAEHARPTRFDTLQRARAAESAPDATPEESDRDWADRYMNRPKPGYELPTTQYPSFAAVQEAGAPTELPPVGRFMEPEAPPPPGPQTGPWPEPYAPVTDYAFAPDVKESLRAEFEEDTNMGATARPLPDGTWEWVPPAGVDRGGREPIILNTEEHRDFIARHVQPLYEYQQGAQQEYQQKSEQYQRDLEEWNRGQGRPEISGLARQVAGAGEAPGAMPPEGRFDEAGRRLTQPTPPEKPVGPAGLITDPERVFRERDASLERERERLTAELEELKRGREFARKHVTDLDEILGTVTRPIKGTALSVLKPFFSILGGVEGARSAEELLGMTERDIAAKEEIKARLDRQLGPVLADPGPMPGAGVGKETLKQIFGAEGVVSGLGELASLPITAVREGITGSAYTEWEGKGEEPLSSMVKRFAINWGPDIAAAGLPSLFKAGGKLAGKAARFSTKARTLKEIEDALFDLALKQADADRMKAALKRADALAKKTKDQARREFVRKMSDDELNAITWELETAVADAEAVPASVKAERAQKLGQELEAKGRRELGQPTIDQPTIERPTPAPEAQYVPETMGELERLSYLTPEERLALQTRDKAKRVRAARESLNVRHEGERAIAEWRKEKAARGTEAPEAPPATVQKLEASPVGTPGVEGRQTIEGVKYRSRTDNAREIRGELEAAGHDVDQLYREGHTPLGVGAEVDARIVNVDDLPDTPVRQQGRLTRATEFLSQGEELTPPLLSVNPDGSYTVVDGVHRIAALKKAGKKRIMVDVYKDHPKGTATGTPTPAATPTPTGKPATGTPTAPPPHPPGDLVARKTAIESELKDLRKQIKKTPRSQRSELNRRVSDLKSELKAVKKELPRKKRTPKPKGEATKQERPKTETEVRLEKELEPHIAKEKAAKEAEQEAVKAWEANKTEATKEAKTKAKRALMDAKNARQRAQKPLTKEKNRATKEFNKSGTVTGAVAEAPAGVATRYQPATGAVKPTPPSKKTALRSEEEITQEIQRASGVPIQSAQLNKERFGSPRYQAINKEIEKSKKELEKLNFKLGKKAGSDELRLADGPERAVLVKQRDDVRAYIQDRTEALREAAPDKPLRDELRDLKQQRRRAVRAGHQELVGELDEKIAAAETKLENLYPVGIYEKAGEGGVTPRGLATVTKSRDTSTALHEAVEGWIDRGRLKKPANAEIHDELVAYAKAQFPDTDPAKIDWKEGASEAAVAWYEDSVDQFSEATQRWLDKNLKRFRRARDQARRLRTATGQEIIEQARTAPQGGRSRYKQLVRDRGYAKGTHKYFSDMYRDWKSAWLDRPGGLFESMSKLGVKSRKGENLYRALERTQGGRVAAYVNEGVIWTPYGYVRNKSLPQIAQDAGSEEVFHDAFTALRAQRSKDLWKRGKKNPILETEADATLAEFKAKYTGDQAKLFKKTQDDIKKWHDGIFQYAVESGAMTEESVKVMRELDPSYVPFTRDLRPMKDQGLLENFKRGGGGGVDVTRMKGSERHALMNPIEAMIGDVNRFLRGLDENVVKQQILADIEMTPGSGALIQRLDKAPADATEFMKRAREELLAAGIDPSDLSDGGDSIMNLVASIPALANKKTANILNVVENGKVISYKVAPEVFNAFSHLPASMHKGVTRVASTLATSDNLISKGARALSNLKRATATTYTLTFPIRNAIRDIMQAIAKKGPITGTKIVATGYAKGAKGLLQRAWHGQYTDDILEAVRASGVRAGRVTYKSTNAKSVQRLYKDLIRNPAARKSLNIVESIGDLLRLAEDAPRIGAGMQALRKAGYKSGRLTPDQMVTFINAFENITVPFKRGGGAAKDLNLVSTFLNARLQGMVNFSRAHPVKAMFSGNKKKAARAKLMKSMLFGLTTTTIPELYLASKYKDEDWYKNLPTWRKNLFLNVRYGGKTWSIPRNPEWGFFYGVLPRVMAQENDNQEELAEAMKDMLDVVDIPAVGTPLAIARNYDPFRERTIESPYDKRVKSERANEFTGEHYKKLAKFFNGIVGEDSQRAWSPDELRYLAESYFTSTLREGGMLLGFKKPSEKQLAYEKISFVDRVLGAKPTRGKHVDKVYDLRKKLEGNQSRTPEQEKTLEEIKKFFQKELPKTKGRKRRRPPGAGRKLLDELREANKAGDLAKVHELSEKRNTLFREKFEAWSGR